MFVDLKFKTANVYNKKQPLEVFYKKAVLKIPVFESLLKKVAGLQIPTQVFFCEYCKFFF